MNFSTQQLAIFRAIETPGAGNLIVSAVAGSGKTTTLVEAVGRMTGSIAFTAYNKKIADEIGARCPRTNTGLRVGTFHSFGFAAWRRVASGVKVNGDKVRDLIQREWTNPHGAVIPETAQEFVRAAVSLAKQHAFGFLSPLEDRSAWWELVNHYELEEKLADNAEFALHPDDLVERTIGQAISVLRRSMELDVTEIDFDDMIFAPLVHNARFWQNDWVLIDEAQDTNPARRALAKKMLKPGGRLVAVGDPHQAIYGFTGADADSLDIIAREFNAKTYPLSVSYRCPRAVVAEAQKFVSHIEAAPDAPLGYTTRLTDEAFLENAKRDLEPSDAILCRNTKPLVAMAYELIRRKIACHVEGRDIGQGLIALAKRWKLRNVGALLDKLEVYLAKEAQRFLAKGQELKAAALEDRVDTLRVIADTLPRQATIGELTSAINALFGDDIQNNVTLSTVHKAKGREWERVYILGRAKFMPSKYARQAWQVGQERNLIYVAVTRAKHTLIDIDIVESKKAAKAADPALVEA